MNPILKNNQERYKNAKLFVFIVLIIAIIQFFIKIADTNWGSNASVYGIILLVITILHYVFYIQWFRRTYNTAHYINKIKPKYSEGMAAGAWFIPIANLYIVYKILEDIRSNFNHVTALNRPDLDIPKSKMISWWVLYCTSIISTILLVLIGFFWALILESDVHRYSTASNIFFYNFIFYVELFSSLIWIIAGVLMLNAMEKINNAEVYIFKNQHEINNFEIEGYDKKVGS